MIKKIPRGVYYLSLLEILKTSSTFLFKKNSPGPEVLEFEKKAAKEIGAPFLKVMPHARISLYYILKSYNLKDGDEVLMSSTTLPDMVNMITLAGLRPVFADFKQNSHVIDLQSAEKLISSRTKILFLTHLYGILPQMDDVTQFCKNHSLYFIQDCTQSYGCQFSGRPIADFADSTFFSTCSLKDLHTHMGSLLFTKSQERLDFINTQTRNDFSLIRKSYFWKFLKEDIIASITLNPHFFTVFTYYIFKIIFLIDPKLIEDLINARGIKIGPFTIFRNLFGETGEVRRKSIPSEMLYHFGDAQAKVGSKGLINLKANQELRRKNSLMLISKLSECARKRLPPTEKESFDTFWRIPIYIDNTKEFESYLFKNGIDPGKTTLPCLPHMEIFKDFEQVAPIAFKMGTNSVFLPNFHYLSEDEINHVAKTVNIYFEKK